MRERGSARLQVELSPDLSGSVQLSAYRITPSSDIIRDSRLLYVNPANDLKIDVRLDRETYRPGQDANIHFTVSDGRGHPVLAALGLSIVDESVFALQEMQPGLEKVYFTLEKELMKPRYEIHGYTLDRMILPQPERDLIEDISRRREAARVLLASVEGFWEPSLKVNTFDDKRQAFATELEAIMREKIAKIEKGLKRFHKRHDRFLKSTETLAALTGERLIKNEDANDPWGNLYVIEDTYFIWNEHLVFKMTSIGPDETAGTADDVVVEHRPQIKEQRWRNAMFSCSSAQIIAFMPPVIQYFFSNRRRLATASSRQSWNSVRVPPDGFSSVVIHWHLRSCQCTPPATALPLLRIWPLRHSTEGTGHPCTALIVRGGVCKFAGRR